MYTLTTTIHEINDGIFRFSTWVPEVGPTGLAFNQFLVTGDEPLLFHTGMRGLFPLVAEAVDKVVPVSSLRWISFGHVEADECGAMNMWLAAAPHSQIAYNGLGCMVSLNDLADRPPRSLADGEVLDIGGKRLRQISTPHVPHGWEAQVLFEETTGTLLCGDLFTRYGDGPAMIEDDVVGPALAVQDGALSMAPNTGAVLRALGDLHPTTLALMHGPSYRGDGARALHDLAAGYEAALVPSG
jgi:flavorubredoxin